MKIIFNNLKRTLKEKMLKYMYIIFPVCGLILYFLSIKVLNKDILNSDTFFDHVIEISLSLFAVLLTLQGLFMSLPNTKYIETLKQYNYHKIINRTLVLGVLAFLLEVIFVIINIKLILVKVLFIIGIIETFILIILFARIFKYSNY